VAKTIYERADLIVFAFEHLEDCSCPLISESRSCSRTRIAVSTKDRFRFNLFALFMGGTFCFEIEDEALVIIDTKSAGLLGRARSTVGLFATYHPFPMRVHVGPFSVDVDELFVTHLVDSGKEHLIMHNFAYGGANETVTGAVSFFSEAQKKRAANLGGPSPGCGTQDWTAVGNAPSALREVSESVTPATADLEDIAAFAEFRRERITGIDHRECLACHPVPDGLADAGIVKYARPSSR